MFFLFTYAVNTIFIPFQRFNSASKEPYTHFELKEMAKTEENLIVYGCRDTRDSLAISFLQIHKFLPNYTYALTTPGDLAQLCHLGVYDHSLAFYKKGEFVSMVGPVEYETSILYLIDLYMSDNVRKPCTTDIQLMAALGQTTISLIVPTSIYDTGLELAKEAGANICSTNLVHISDELSSYTGLGINRMALYREYDRELVEIEPTIDSFMENYQSSFTIAKYEQLVDFSKTIIGLISNQDIIYHNDYLYNISHHFPNYSVILIREVDQWKLLEKFKIPYIGYQDLCVFNFNEGWMHNVSNYIDVSLKETYFMTDQWIESTISVMEMIHNDTIPKQYISEDPSNKFGDDLIMKVVASTYEEFINLPGDKFLLFIVPRCNECNKAIGVLKQVKQNLNDQGITNITFGVLDYEKNAVPGGFKSIIKRFIPQAHFYKGKNKDLIPFGAEFSDVNIHWFMKFFSSIESYPILPTLVDIPEFYQELDNIEYKMSFRDHLEANCTLKFYKMLENQYNQTETKMYKDKLKKSSQSTESPGEFSNYNDHIDDEL